MSVMKKSECKWKLRCECDEEIRMQVEIGLMRK